MYKKLRSLILGMNEKLWWFVGLILGFLLFYEDWATWLFGIMKFILGAVGCWLSVVATHTESGSMSWLSWWALLAGIWMFGSGAIRVRDGPTTAECAERRKKIRERNQGSGQ